MATNRLIVILIALTVIMQGALLYRQYHGSGVAPSPKREPPVKDAPKGLALDLTHLPSKGSPTAKVILVEFSDYQCPFCARYATGVGKDVEKEFVQTGKVKLVFVNNPLPSHPNAKSLATAAICAGDQGHYWEMHDSLFSVTPKTPEDLMEITQKLLLDSEKFQQCTGKSPEPARVIDRDLKKSKEFQVTGTPSFAIGQVSSQGQVSFKKLIFGAQPIEVFKKTIEDVLAEPVASTPSTESPIRRERASN
jgi:protein-disulfide isomerase